MMELGATLCTPKSPQCLLCPVAQFCAGRKLGIAKSWPEKRKKRATVNVTLAAAIYLDENGRTLLLPTPPKEKQNTESQADYIPLLVSNLWHFPTVAVRGNSAAKLRTHLGKLIRGSRHRGLHFVPAGQMHHTLTYPAITRNPFLIPVKRPSPITRSEIVA